MFHGQISFFIKRLFIPIALCFVVKASVYGQTIKSIADIICDSISKMECVDEKDCASKQRGIYNDEMLKYPSLVVDITDLNKPHQYNEYNYKINRELIRDCKNYVDQFSLLPLSKILDLEGLFSRQQYDSLERLIIEFIHFKKIDLLVVSIDDAFPYSDPETFSNETLLNWKIGKRYAGGGLLLYLSKSSNTINIISNEKNEEIIPSEKLKEAISEDVLEKFDEGKYFNAVYQSILNIKSLL